MRKILYFAVLTSLVMARENPFVPTSELNTSVMTTNLKESYETLEKQDVNFSQDANLLLNIVFNYRASDGSIKQKVIDINKTVDGSSDYILSKMQLRQSEAVPKLDVSVTIAEQKPLDVNLTKKGKHSVANIEVPMPTDIKLEPIKTSPSATTVPVIGANKEQRYAQKNEPIPATKTALDINLTMQNSNTQIDKTSTLQPAKKVKNLEKMTKKNKATNKQEMASTKSDASMLNSNAENNTTIKQALTMPQTLEDKLSSGFQKPQHFIKREKKEHTKALKSQEKSTKQQSRLIISGLKFLKFELIDGGLKIITKDKMIENFAYENNKIVIDFKAKYGAFTTKNIMLNSKNFKDIVVGWHKGNYRVVVRMDAKFGYVVKPLAEEGYILELKR